MIRKNAIHKLLNDAAMELLAFTKNRSRSLKSDASPMTIEITSQQKMDAAFDN